MHIFFFSSRRRHTRYWRDWSSDVCSSDLYSTFLRTPDDGERAISCFHLTPDLAGFSAAPPEQKMGLTGSTTAAMRLDDVAVPAGRMVGEPRRGLAIALSALDPGRLGVRAEMGRASCRERV